MTPDAPPPEAADPSDLIAALERLRAILSAAHGQVTVALEEAAKFPAPAKGDPCPRCGVVRPARFMADHLLDVHGLEDDDRAAWDEARVAFSEGRSIFDPEGLEP